MTAFAALMAVCAFEKIALVDHYDFHEHFDTETASGITNIVDHVLETGADTVLWRNCGGGTMRYQTTEDTVADAPLQPLRLPSSRSQGWLRHSKAEPDIIRTAFAYLDSRGVRRGIHWPFEENHHNCWTLSGWNLDHPQFWCRSSAGIPWAGRCSLAFPEVAAHKLRLLDELSERGNDTLFIDTHRTGQWTVADEFVKPNLDEWRRRYGAEAPSPGDDRWIALVAESQYAFFRSVKARLCDGGRKARLCLGLSSLSPGRDGIYRKFGIDWRRLAREGVVDAIFVQSVVLPGRGDVWEELRAAYMGVYAERGLAKVYFPVMQYSVSGNDHNGYPWYAKKSGMSEVEAVRRLLSLAAECGGSGIFMECVDYGNYKPEVREAIRGFIPSKEVQK